MEEFDWLKSGLPLSDDEQSWEVVTNLWLVWRGARPAFLAETSDYGDRPAFAARVDEFVARHADTLGRATDSYSTAVLVYNRALAPAADVEQYVTRGPGREMALARLLRFGCADPSFFDESITRIRYSLQIASDQFPEHQLLSFICSERVPQPSEARLRETATPIKQALRGTFGNVIVKWSVAHLMPVSKLVNMFVKFVKQEPGGELVTRDETRKVFADVLADGEGFEQLADLFDEPDGYAERIWQNRYAVLALLLVKQADPCDFEIMPAENMDHYMNSIRQLETNMFRWLKSSEPRK